jgi:hypothetical protein
LSEGLKDSTVANHIPLHGLLFQRGAMHGPIELTPEAESRTTGKGYFRMTDETEQTHPAETADVSQQQPSEATTYVAQQLPSAESSESPSKPIFVFASAAVALGLMVGVVFAMVSSHPAGRGGPHDLPPLISATDGLKGVLTLSWNGKLEYRLVVEPSDPGQQDEFSLAASNPPRPLSINIQLKDSAGSVLCNKDVLLKFDPSQAATFAPAGTGVRLVRASAGRKAQATDIAASEALEVQREQGQDMFQNDTGRYEQIEDISVLGQMPCTMQAYQRTASWSFSPDFLILDEQAALLKRHAELQEAANTPQPDSSTDNQASNTRRKARRKQPEEFKAFAIEGDDELVAFDSSKGLVETNAKTFIIVKASGDGNTTKWSDMPANVHYKCDMNAACTLTRSGAVLLYARLSH